MKERPILFSGPMVSAILNGSKTMTRRVAKEFTEQHAGILKRFPNQQGCPYGKPGDRLWVRETFYVDHGLYANRERFAEGPPDESFADYTYYRADGECCQQIPECQCAEVGKPKWRPSIFMPKWASRLALEITDTKVERIQDISESDAMDEGAGISAIEHPEWDGDPDQYRKLLRGRWDVLNGKRGYGWASNCPVWCVGFKKI